MEEKSKKGRKGKYDDWKDPVRLEWVTGWCRRGLSDEQVANNIGISIKTLYNWQNEHPEFKEAMKIGKEVADLMIENALFKRAFGFTIEDTKRTFSEKDGEKIETTKKNVPGDVNAQMFWLKNRRPDLWKEKREEEVKQEIAARSIVVLPEVEILEEPMDESTMETTT